MKNIKVLLVCGGGASSGFMAVNLRKAAKARGIDMDAKARSETEAELYASEVDCIMIGPHLSYLVDDLRSRLGESGPKLLLMSKSYYSTLDGDEALDALLAVLGRNTD